MTSAEWISVNDMLPECKACKYITVLCATKSGFVGTYLFGGAQQYYEIPHFWNGMAIVDQYVTHWMYLPEPPDEAKEDLQNA